MSHNPNETVVVPIHMTPLMFETFKLFGAVVPMNLPDGTRVENPDVEDVLKALIHTAVRLQLKQY